jgi:hypothetical protein
VRRNQPERDIRDRFFSVRFLRESVAQTDRFRRGECTEDEWWQLPPAGLARQNRHRRWRAAQHLAALILLIDITPDRPRQDDEPCPVEPLDLLTPLEPAGPPGASASVPRESLAA